MSRSNKCEALAASAKRLPLRLGKTRRALSSPPRTHASKTRLAFTHWRPTQLELAVIDGRQSLWRCKLRRPRPDAGRRLSRHSRRRNPGKQDVRVTKPERNPEAQRQKKATGAASLCRKVEGQKREPRRRPGEGCHHAQEERTSCGSEIQQAPAT